MTKVIEFDLSDADEDVWEQGEGRVSEKPKPGVYKCVVEQINPGFTNNDKDRPRLEVIYKVVGDAHGNREPLEELGHEGGDCYGAWLWEYVSFTKASEWKQAQFFKALGVGNPKKTKGKFDAEKHEGTTEVAVRVKHGTYEGNYSPDVSAVWAWDDYLKSLDETDDEVSDIEEELDDDEFFDDDDAEEGVTADDIRGMSKKELKALADEHDVNLKGMNKEQAVEALIEEVVGDDWDEDDVPF